MSGCRRTFRCECHHYPKDAKGRDLFIAHVFQGGFKVKVRSPARLEDVVLPKRKKGMMDFMLWLGTSNEAFMLVKKWTTITPVVFFFLGTLFLLYLGWVEVAVITGVFLAWACWNLKVQWPMMFTSSGASLKSVVDGKYGETYEDLSEDHWEEVFGKGGA